MNDETMQTIEPSTPPKSNLDPPPAEEIAKQTAQKEEKTAIENSVLPEEENGGKSSASETEPAPDPNRDNPLSDNVAQDPDLDPHPAGKEPDGEIARLKEELRLLREELMQSTHSPVAEAADRMRTEYAEFSALYPDVSPASLPDSVWESVRAGIPLAAAYALAERQKFCITQRANACNRENQKRSTGALNGTENDLFSPAEVRAMSAEEVHKNYQKIIRSMQKWH